MVGRDAPLSESPGEIASLFTAVQLARLRDRLKGTTRLDYSCWLEPMEGPELEVRRLSASPVGEGKKSGRKKEGHEPILWRVAIFERDFALWRDVFANETNTIAHFLKLLANLQLNVSPELEELKSLSQRNEDVLLRMQGFTKRLSAIVAGEKTGGFDDNASIYRELLRIADSLEKLKSRVDEKAEDAVRLISLMTPSVESQTLIDLLTGEV